MGSRSQFCKSHILPLAAIYNVASADIIAKDLFGHYILSALLNAWLSTHEAAATCKKWLARVGRATSGDLLRAFNVQTDPGCTAQTDDKILANIKNKNIQKI